MTAAMSAVPMSAPSALAIATGDAPLARFVTEGELIDALTALRTATIVTIQSRTEPRLAARHRVSGQPNPFKGNVVKVSRVNGVVNWIYASSVNRQRCREDLTPDFQPLPRKWGTRLLHSPLVLHNGGYYVELKVERSLDHRYETLDGQPLDTAEVEAYLPPHGPSRQGVSREIILRDYALENIVRMKMLGTTYILRSAVEDATGASEPSRMSA